MTTPTAAPRELTATGRCRCHACGEHFQSASAFEMHRVGEFDRIPPHYGRRCLTPVEMRAKDMGTTVDGRWWTTTRDPPPWATRNPHGDAFDPTPPTDAPR